MANEWYKNKLLLFIGVIIIGFILMNKAKLGFLGSVYTGYCTSSEPALLTDIASGIKTLTYGGVTPAQVFTGTKGTAVAWDSAMTATNPCLLCIIDQGAPTSCSGCTSTPAYSAIDVSTWASSLKTIYAITDLGASTLCSDALEARYDAATGDRSVANNGIRDIYTFNKGLWWCDNSNKFIMVTGAAAVKDLYFDKFVNCKDCQPGTTKEITCKDASKKVITCTTPDGKWPSGTTIAITTGGTDMCWNCEAKSKLTRQCYGEDVEVTCTDDGKIPDCPKQCITKEDCKSKAKVDCTAVTTCTADADCGTGNVCVSGKCAFYKDYDCLVDGSCKIATTTAGSNCLGCLSNATCASGTNKICDMSSKICVACLAPSDCAASKKTCDKTNKVCVGCLASTDCTFNSSLTKCDTTNKLCIGCLTNADCTSGKVCDSTTKSCKATATCDWNCTSWSSCDTSEASGINFLLVPGEQTRTCANPKACTTTKPSETRACEVKRTFGDFIEDNILLVLLFVGLAVGLIVLLIRGDVFKKKRRR